MYFKIIVCSLKPIKNTCSLLYSSSCQENSKVLGMCSSYIEADNDPYSSSWITKLLLFKLNSHHYVISITSGQQIHIHLNGCSTPVCFPQQDTEALEPTVSLIVGLRLISQENGTFCSCIWGYTKILKTLQVMKQYSGAKSTRKKYS